MDNANNPLFPAPAAVPRCALHATPKAAKRVLEFFTAQINNDHKRKACLNPTRRFAQSCAAHEISEATDRRMERLMSRRKQTTWPWSAHRCLRPGRQLHTFVKGRCQRGPNRSCDVRGKKESGCTLEKAVKNRALQGSQEVKDILLLGRQ